MNDDIRIEVGKRIRHFRKSRGYTLDSFSALLHKSKSILSKYERGDVTVDIVTLQEIAEALQIPMTVLLENVGKSSASLYPFGKPPITEEQRERFYCYSIMSHSKATLQKSLLLMGNTTATCYMNIDSEENVQRYESLFAGQVRRSNSFIRLFLTNVIHEDDQHVIEIPLRLGEHQCTIAFVVSLSIGGWYPIAGSFLLSKLPIRDLQWVWDILAFSKEDLKAFKYQNAYFAVHNYSIRMLELRRPF